MHGASAAVPAGADAGEEPKSIGHAGRGRCTGTALRRVEAFIPQPKTSDDWNRGSNDEP